MKKYSIPEAVLMLNNKRGAGKTKHVKIKLNIDIEFDAGPNGAQSFLDSFMKLFTALMTYRSPYVAYIMKNIKVQDKSYVITELEKNPDWE